VGIATVFLGFLLLTAPGTGMVLLVQLLGLYWLASGIVHLATLFVDTTGWGWKVAGGILGIIAGLITIQHPLWSAIVLPTALVFFIGVLGLLFGITGIIAAFTGAGWGVGIAGALSVVFGLLLMFNPLGPAVALPFLLGMLAIAGGVAGTIVAFRDRNTQNRSGGTVPASS
jgi:uncharacterized membrane protein HdeD (DUF308 family)